VPAVIYPQKYLLVLISVRVSVKPWAMVWLEGLGKLKKKNPVTSSGLKPTTFWLIA
jgi:hypothetical protein